MVVLKEHLEDLVPSYLLDSVLYHVLILGFEGEFLFVNQKFRDAYPKLFSGPVTHCFRYVLRQKDIAKWERIIDTCEGTPSGCATANLKRLNAEEVGYIPSQWQFSKMKDEAGSPIGYLCIGHDLPAERTTRKPQKEKQYLEAIIRQTGDCFFQLDKRWRIVEINEPAAKAMGASREELLMKNLWEVHREHKEFTYPELLKEAMDRNHPVFFNEYDAHMNMWYQVAVYTSRLGVTVFFRDVTEEKRRNDEAIRSSVVLRSVLESTNDCFFLINGDKKIEGFNHTAKTYLRKFFNRSVKKGDDFRNCIKLMQMPEFDRALEEAFTKDSVEFEREIFFPNGESSWFLFKFSPVRNVHGHVDNIAFTCKNIDQTKRYYLQLEQKNKVLREIAYNQSHVIRSPLSSILGLLALIDGSKLSPEDRELFDMLKPLANKLDNVIKNNVNRINELEE